MRPVKPFEEWDTYKKLHDFARKYGLRRDWHEPDEQEVSAKVVGQKLDNAMGDRPCILRGDTTPCEMIVELYVKGRKKLTVNLATVLALAARVKEDPPDLWAIVDDKQPDGFVGDSAFYCPTSRVPYKEGMTFKDVVAAYREKIIKEDGNQNFPTTDDEADGEVGEITTIYIVTSTHVKLMEDAAPECGGDSETYMVNAIMKQMAAALAVKTLTEK